MGVEVGAGAGAEVGRLPRRVIREAGGTLVEAMVALLVLSLGLASLAQLQVSVLAATGESKAQTLALNLAQRKLERLRARPYTEIESGSDRPPPQPGDNRLYEREWSITEARQPAFKWVSVTTSWQTAQADLRSLTLTSIIAPSRP